MTVETTTTTRYSGPTTIHPGWVLIHHWLNFLATLIMIGRGWQIYNASPLFAFEFSRSIALGEWLGGGRKWYFAAMWLPVINGSRLRHAWIRRRPLPARVVANPSPPNSSRISRPRSP